ncbi:YaaR family protein [Bacillus sp. B15-48]|uniref:YaaR family protein n=1 Tax=Bacillus sp. B15-48 TaxID=1548601 RepID=UPI00193FFA0A|nr:YaaR family protein [Bacillus sp. B15-48]
MKIQQNIGINPDRYVPVRLREKESPSFQSILSEKQSQLSQDRLQALFLELEQQGKRLTHSRSLHDIMEYKQIIRNFLKEVVQSGYALEDHQGFHPNGREKQLKIIKQVDEKLIELSEQVLTKQTPSVEILTKLGEIKGLLVNLYT